MTYAHGHIAPIVSSLPWWITRWIGYRPPAVDSNGLPLHAVAKVPASVTPGHRNWPEEVKICFWSFVASFCAISVIQAVFHSPYFITKGAPTIVASFGSSAVLIYGSIDSAYAQPRPLLGGHIIGAAVGICTTKLIELLSTKEEFHQFEWLAGSLSCALSVVLMQLTSTIHPPAGATALLATVNADVRDLSWYFLPIIILTASLSLVIALLLNNIQRRYPKFWFAPDTPTDAAKILVPKHTSSSPDKQKPDEPKVLDVPPLPPPSLPTHLLPKPPPRAHPALHVIVGRAGEEPPRSPLTPSRPTF
ncbi:hypothetical protein ONZ45_g15764 [Pleurotus djamor]|nr:hypothetical protein ONZ45_g15764 [Pleurotus djamor]